MSAASLPYPQRTGANHAGKDMEVLAAGKAVRNIVQSAVRMRLFLQKRNLCKNYSLTTPLCRLQAWLTSYPCPSTQTLVRFRTSVLANDLRAVMPHNKGGLSLLDQFDSLTKTLRP